MNRLLLGIAFLSGAGCDRVFSIDRSPNGPNGPNGPTCPYDELLDGADDDHDGVLNAADTCPLVAAHDPHDEDGDTEPDDCDLCPLHEVAGLDLDCDGLGAACDPDDMVPHVRIFYGFGSGNGLTVRGDASIMDDVLRFAPNLGRYMMVTPTARTPADGIYELHAQLTGVDTTYWNLGFVFQAEGGPQYRAAISGDTGDGVTGELFVRDETAGKLLGVTSIPLAFGQFDFTLVARIAGTTVTISTDAFPGATLSLQVPGLGGDLLWGITANRETAATVFRADVTYLQKLALAPPP